MESLKYDSATYADLVASQLQEERYATWVKKRRKCFRERLMAGCFFFPPFSFQCLGPQQNPWYTVESNGSYILTKTNRSHRRLDSLDIFFNQGREEQKNNWKSDGRFSWVPINGRFCSLFSCFCFAFFWCKCKMKIPGSTCFPKKVAGCMTENF